MESSLTADWIISPKLEWIAGRCYRILSETDAEEHETSPSYENKSKPWTTRDAYFDEDDDYVDPECNIQYENNRFIATIHVPEPLWLHVFGRKPTVKIIQRIASDTDTDIKVPLTKNPLDDVYILGNSRKSVLRAFDIIKYKRIDNRFRLDHTHFVSIPMQNDVIQESFQRFKEEVLSLKNVHGVDESIFEKPSKLHLTIAMLCLLDKKEIEKADAILNDCRAHISNILCESNLTVLLKGVEYMNDDPSAVDVLYAKIQEPDGHDRLQVLANHIRKTFVDAGFARSEKDDENVKMHVTLMNSKFRNVIQDARPERKPFNAKPILEKCADYLFGEVHISEIHISIRFTQRKDGYYNPSVVLKLH